MVRLKGLHAVKSKGRTYYYAWRGGPRIEAEFGTPGFFQEFSDAKNPIVQLDRRKFGAWVVLYNASDDYAKLADTTKRVWSPWFDRIRDEFGDLRTRQFDRPAIRVDIRNWRNKWRDTPRAADVGKQVLSRILSFAVAEGGLSLNPCAEVPNLYRNDRSEIIWLKDDIGTFCKTASPELGWACKLAALTGLRQSDLLRVSWNQVGQYAIEIKTGKSRGRRTATAPITAEIRALLDAIPKRSTRVLTNTRGQPWKAGFSTSWNDAMHASGLAADARDLHFHDLRGTAATNYYLADFTVREIAETLAWSEDRVERLIDRYVKRDEILKDRIRRLERRSS
jgi:integrase